MDIKEFVGIDPNRIRNDKELMQLYINFYEAAFSFIPNCAGCSFKTRFNKLKQYAFNGKKNINFDKNTTEMKTTKTFLLKPIYQTKILTYVDSNKAIHRTYGYSLTEEFANELVKSGKGDHFNKLPKGSSDSKKETSKAFELKEETTKESKYASMAYRKELLPLYTEARERTGKEAKTQSKEDIIKFLQDNEG